jgi:hypothetical protein
MRFGEEHRGENQRESDAMFQQTDYRVAQRVQAIVLQGFHTCESTGVIEVE